MKKLLKWIAAEMKAAGIEYHFRRNKSKTVKYPYFVGDLYSVIPVTEDGKQEYSLLLSGFIRTPGTDSALYDCAQLIEDHFDPVEGLTGMVGNQAIVAWYSGVEPVDTEDEQLSRVDVTLTIKTWKER